MANVTEMPPSEAAESEDSAAESAPQETRQKPQQSKHAGGRPQKGQQRAPEPKIPQFFERVASVPKEDWGTRAFMYVYADEPVCSKKTFGETRYLLKSSAPILDFEQLKEDYGSFKGWMSLNLRKTGKDATDEVDRLNFEIYDPKHPPKIPRSAWANDDRNKRWADLLPPEAPAASAAATSLLDGIKVYKEIRDEVKEEMPEQPSNSTRDTLETMKLAKELFGQPAPATATDATDPLKIAIGLATTMMQMRAENPMVDAMREDIKAMREETAKMREREFELQKQVLDAKQNAPQPKGIIDQLVELASATEKLEPVKKLFAGLFGTAGETVRAAKMGTLEFFADVIPKIAESPILTAVATKMMMQPANGAPAVVLPNLPNPAVQAPQVDQQAEFLNFMKYAISPALIEYLESGEPGDEFAAWVNNAYPDKLIQLQKFRHPMIPGLPGPPSIMAAYRNSPLWPRIAARGEAVFNTFVNEFCAWKPEGEASAASPPASGEPIDLDNELGGNV